MHLNAVLLTFCLLGAAVLLQALTTSLPPATTKVTPTPPGVTDVTGSPTDVPTGSHTNDPTGSHTNDPTGSHTNDPTGSHTIDPTGGTQTPDATETSVTTPQVEEPPPGLSPGAIAGITIGSIAGVAAVGGGVFGLLKYTGKI